MIFHDFLFKIPGLNIVLQKPYDYLAANLRELPLFQSYDVWFSEGKKARVDVEKLMKVLDSNADGIVEVEEAVQKLKGFGISNAVELIVQVDLNQDGFIDKDELERLALLVISDQEKGSLQKMVKTMLEKMNRLENQIKQYVTLCCSFRKPPLTLQCHLSYLIHQKLTRNSLHHENMQLNKTQLEMMLKLGSHDESTIHRNTINHRTSLFGGKLSESQALPSKGAAPPAVSQLSNHILYMNIPLI
jgi:hypothetical protein